jgi:hypothetical protein
MKTQNKELVFICLSCISIGSLFGGFAGNLESFEVWKQPTVSSFNRESKQIFILTERTQKPYGLSTNQAQLIASNYTSDIVQKSLLLGVAGVSSAIALLLANINFDELQLNWEVARIETEGKKQLLSEKIKNKYALMSLAQREQFRLEIASLLELTGGDETLEASEINSTDKFINCSYLIAEGHDINTAIAQTWNVHPGTKEHTLKKLDYEAWTRGEPLSKHNYYEEDEQ